MKTRRRFNFLLTSLVFGYAFLYIPIYRSLFSLSTSRNWSLSGGFSTKWYGELFRNEQIIRLRC